MSTIIQDVIDTDDKGLTQNDFIDLGQYSPIPEKVLTRAKKHIITHYNQKQKVPPVIWLSQKLGLSRVKTSSILKVLAVKGFLEKNGNRYILLSTDGSEFRTISKLDKAKAQLKLSPGMLILKGILFLIGSTAAYMSVFHSVGFLSEYYTPTKSILAGCVMVLFNIIAADLIVFFRIKGHKLISNVFIVILILGTLFSMSSTVVGLYNKTTYSKKEAIIEENKIKLSLLENQQEYTLIVDSKLQALNNMELDRDKLNRAMNAVSLYTPEMIEVNPQLYKEVNWAKVLADRSLVVSTEKYDTLVFEEKEYIRNNNTVTQDNSNIPDNAYVWIGDTFNINPDSIQFWMSCYPALFYDIISPVAFCIILFVTGEPKKKSRVKKGKSKRGRK